MIQRFMIACVLVAGWLAVLGAPVTVRAQTPPPNPQPVPSASPSAAPSVPPGTGPSSWSVEYWFTAPFDQQKYEAWRDTTGLVWTINKMLFVVSDSLATFRIALQGMFGSVLGVFGAAVLPIVQPLLLLGVFMALLLALVRPFVSVSVASARRGLGLALVVPLLFPAMGVVYTQLETIRSDLGRAFGTLVFDAASATQNGAPAALPVYDAAAPNRLADVAAATLFVTAADVATPEDTLPDAFVTEFYTAPPTDWSSLAADARQAYKTQSVTGFRRMFFGLVPASLMVLDAVLQTTWSLVLGLLFLGLTLALCFAVFGPFAGSVYRISIMIFNVLVSSWAVSAVQGVLIAYLVRIAATGSATAVIAMSGFVLFLHVVFLLGAALVGIRALFVTAGSTMPDAPEMAGQALRTASGGIVGGVAGALAGVNGMEQRGRQAMYDMGRSATAYIGARRFGATPNYALGYALAPSDAAPALAKAGIMAGVLDPEGDLNQGIYDGAMRAHGNVTSYRAIMQQTRRHRGRQPLPEHRASPPPNVDGADAAPAPPASAPPPSAQTVRLPIEVNDQQEAQGVPS